MAMTQKHNQKPARRNGPAQAPAEAASDELEDDIEDERQSRAQETHDAEDAYDEYGDDWQEVGLLDAPKPRAGYVQRYVATHINGDPNPQNVASQMNKGWKPREAGSVPEGTYAPTISHGQFDGYIGVEGQVLMERPIRLHKRFKDKIRESTNAQMQAVDNDLHKVHDPSSGLGAPSMTRKSAVTRGKPIQAAPDE